MEYKARTISKPLRLTSYTCCSRYPTKYPSMPAKIMKYHVLGKSLLMFAFVIIKSPPQNKYSIYLEARGVRTLFEAIIYKIRERSKLSVFEDIKISPLYQYIYKFDTVSIPFGELSVPQVEPFSRQFTSCFLSLK